MARDVRTVRRGEERRGEEMEVLLMVEPGSSRSRGD
jgi:hypothetical protein